MRLGWKTDEVGVTGDGGVSMAFDGHPDGCVLMVPVGWSWMRLVCWLDGLMTEQR